ncbi:Vesicle-mediated ER to Golgi transport protein [Phlyctochytrium planicorne]|nr:Vesicle-mediated ER to Golgi transport protein [Phlyctochytrium planicorne]
MNFLFGGFEALKGEKGQTQNAQDTIDKLTDRVANATLLEDRRAAVLGLKGLARDWRLDVGTKGMPVLIQVLTNDRHDIEIIRPTLETLQILCSNEDEAGHSPTKTPPTSPAKDTQDLGLMFSEIYNKSPANIGLLLDILEIQDFYVRFHTVQLLATLLQNLGDKLHDSIMNSPLGIPRLIDLLDDHREIIRNEGLLLLIALTKSNAEIQKIIAFENAFERLLGIVSAEGAADGGIIVQDCLTLTLNLLRYNVSNQNLFRESSCIQKIPSLLLSRLDDESEPVPLTHPSNTWSEQKTVNAVLVLELVRILVGPNNPNTSSNQNVIFQSHVINPIFDLGFSDKVPPRVKAQALFAIGESMRGNPQGQDLFSKHVIVSSPASSKSPKGANGEIPTSALLSVVKSALKSTEDFSVRAAATFCFQSLIYENADNQLALAATFTPPPPENPNEESGGDEPISLLHKVMFALSSANKDGADIRIRLGILSLIATWLYECPRAVREYLSEGSNLQFLIEQINHSSGVDPLVQGLASYLLALCHEFNDDSEPAFTQASLQTLIVSRIGSDVFASRIERLRESKQFQKVSNYLLPPDFDKDSKTLPEVYFDLSFVDLLKSTYDSLVRTVVNPKPKTANQKKEDSQQKSLIESYKNLMATQNRELEEARKAVAESEAKRMEETLALTSQINSLVTTVKSLELRLAETTDKLNSVSREQDDLLVCLAESDITIRQLKTRLRALGQEVESDGDEEDEEEEGAQNGV